jgi:demethylmenaquinone methyltransferase / 2-methoxy-6-polyprenyl-1,4-benzoquinol methylase
MTGSQMRENGDGGEKVAATSGSPAAGGAAWTQQDLAKGPHSTADKQERVRRMFAAIAKAYELNNTLHSFGQDAAWRKFAVKKAELQGGERVLDVACGTGDLSRAFARAVPAVSHVTGLDYTAEMLDVAREQLPQAKTEIEKKITYVQGDAQALQFPDASFEVVSIAFGIRNVQVPAKAASEFYRVLKPGGRLIVLEFDRPRNGLVRFGNDVYTKHVMPRTATWISGDKSGAYRYLPKSVESFLTAEQLEALWRGAGFGRCERWTLTFGVCVCHRAVKGA